MNDDIAIKVDNLTKVYKLYPTPLDRLKESLHPFRRKFHTDFYALNDVSFNVNKGETVGIIGRNGSGKSTLLKLITGVLTPTNGSIWVNGKISALLELGAGFNPELTGIENIYFNGTFMGYSKRAIDEKLDDILAFADIGGFARQPIKLYSSGMFVRLAFSLAICVEPDILIVDEALSVGDIKFQRKCYSKIDDLKSANKTILFVSHSTAVMNNLCDEAMLLDKGNLIRVDEPRVISKMYHELVFGEQIDKSEREHLPSATSHMTSQREKLRNQALDRLSNHQTEHAPQELRHGNRKAEIIDFGIFDLNETRVANLSSGQNYSFCSRALFYESCDKVFASFVIRDVQGVELYYSNTEILHVDVPSQVAGDILEIRVNVTMWLASGDYFLSFAILDRETSDFLDRRMDAFHFKVTSDSITCGGYVNLGSVFEIKPLFKVEVGEIMKPDQQQHTYYSQHGEDVILDQLFNRQKNGFFVEVGCIDGRRFSNTLCFEERGWSGLCIEAHADYIDLLRQNRPKSIICHCAAAEGDENDAIFYSNSRGSLSTLDCSKETFFKDKYGKWFTGFEKQKVQKRRLDSLFKEYSINKIDLLSLDIEGYEIEALKGIDFNLYRPKVLVIEAETKEAETTIESIMVSHNYHKFYKLHQNLFFIANEVEHLLDGFHKKQIYANVTHTQHPLDKDGDALITVSLST
ncbi:FkbM family methyltransferase [Geotalea sp. SG265]|uniref:FkbM family methyltransferase n=1 Tax=Geotalea sp. SG265 TaxID=2922867 RepID=UPI001FAF91F3|nr:FkbM family methyltransferase [Geotalea sp. SG265]